MTGGSLFFMSKNLVSNFPSFSLVFSSSLIFYVAVSNVTH